MLHNLGVKSIQLLTNKPKKVEELTRLGVKVSGRLPHVIPPNSSIGSTSKRSAIAPGTTLDAIGKPHLPSRERKIRDGRSLMTAMVQLGTKFEQALKLALRVYADDTRKRNKRTPYVSHLLGVASLVLMDDGSEDEAVAAAARHASRIIPRT